MINCRDAARLASESLDRRLSFGEKVALKLHLMMCSMCNRFVRQLEFIRNAASAFAEVETYAAYPSETRLSPEARERIMRALTLD